MKPLPKLRSGLHQHQLEKDSLVYDAEFDQIHLLNATTAQVVKFMTEGLDSDAISKKIGGSAGAEAGAEMLALALDELAMARLTQTREEELAKPVLSSASRRQMIQRVVGVSAALLLPGILTLTPSKAGAQTSVANGQACKHNNQCLSNCCQGGGNNGACNNNTCVDPNAACAQCTP